MQFPYNILRKKEKKTSIKKEKKKKLAILRITNDKQL